jgi:hypothetical protein
MAKDEPQAIRFSAQPSKFTTLVDGTKRIYLDLVRTDKATNAEILETVGVPGVLWEVAAVAVLIDKQQDNNAIPKGKERESKWTPAETKSTD